MTAVFDHYDRGFAVIRIDDGQKDRGHVQVLKIVLDQATAEAEVKQLSSANGARLARYEWQPAGIESATTAFAPPDSAAGELLTSPEPPWVVLSPGLEPATLAARVPPSVTYRALRGRKMATRQGVFNETGAAFQFPADVPENWNGFEECVQDLRWMRSPAYLIAISDADQLLVSEGNREFATFLDILAQTAEAWARRIDPRGGTGVPFHCVLSCAPRQAHDAIRKRLAAIGRDLPILTEASWRKFAV